jgi:hypothetical protein
MPSKFGLEVGFDVNLCRSDRCLPRPRWRPRAIKRNERQANRRQALGQTKKHASEPYLRLAQEPLNPRLIRVPRPGLNARDVIGLEWNR